MKPNSWNPGFGDWRRDKPGNIVAAAMRDLRAAAQQAQAEAWKLSKSDVQFLKSIQIQP